MSDLKNLAAIAGTAPNEIFSRTGQVTVIVSVISLLGLEVSGVEMHGTTQYAPYVTLIVGMFSLYMGYKIKKNADIARQNIEKDKRKNKRVAQEPTEGDEKFLEAFLAKSPMTAVDAKYLIVKHDQGKTKADLIETINMQRLSGWINRGKVVKYGNQYYERSQFEAKKTDETVYQS